MGMPRTAKIVNSTRQLHEGSVFYDREKAGSSNINAGVKPGWMIPRTLFSIFVAAFIYH